MRQSKPPKQETPPENGFYMEHFTRAEIADLDRALGQSLGGEISMLRIVMRRFFEKAAQEAEDLEMLADALRILGMSCTRLARIIQTENKLQDRRMDELGDALNASMTAVLEEMNQSRLGHTSDGGQDGR